MGFERVTLFGTVEALVEAPFGGTLTLSTDMPSAMTQRGSLAIPPKAGRQVARLRLHGVTKGNLYQIEITTIAQMRIYGCRIWARQLGVDKEPWRWYAVPIIETPAEYVPVKLPVESSGDVWAPVKLPIESSGDVWTPVKLPVEPTPDSFSPEKIPMRTTAPQSDWVDVPVDE